MKIASWNVNSLKVRLPQVLTWLASEKPDLLALQELKQENQFFPEKDFQTRGYQHVVVNGQKTYNGVALLSRYPLNNVETPDPDSQHRIITASVRHPNPHYNIRVINLYVPNGESVTSDKYAYKLNWLLNLKHYLAAQLAQYSQVIILGDFNVAPEDQDVHDPERWKEKVLCSTLERQALKDILALGLWDSFRLFPQFPKIYSWWDYRMLGFQRNAGLRIDHILISKKLVKDCEQSFIDKTPRGWERPSDHAPVIVVLK